MTSVAESGPRQGRGVGGERVAVRLLWAVFAGLCVFYSVFAFNYFISFSTGQPIWWNHFMAALLSEQYAFGPGSVHMDQAVPYSAGLLFLLVHTTMGAVCLAIGPFQFSSRIRQRYPAYHRAAGKVYLTSVTLSMVAGLAYLSQTPAADVFSGAPFAIGLWGLDFMVLLTAYLAYAAIRKRDVVRHQAWMAFNLSLIFATPMLRIFWVVFGWTLPSFNQAEANIGIMTYLLPFCLLGGMIWFSVQHGGRKAAA